MAGIAQLAREAGHTVSGSDAQVYPPMSTLLEDLGIEVAEGYSPATIPGSTDVVVVGNALSRGNPAVEYLLDSGRPFTSGPQWLHDHVLRGRRVVAVAGTHGKTTTSSMVCHVMQRSGIDCGFLIGGVPGNLDRSAALGSDPWFVIEADEYDTAFFDKRSKFVHYSPEVVVLNNIEFDHADIFDSLDDIKRQFHHLLRIVPSRGTVIHNADDAVIDSVLEMGCYSHRLPFGEDFAAAGFRLQEADDDYSHFRIVTPAGVPITIGWKLFGRHNALNAVAACAACACAGVSAASAGGALADFKLPRRRLQRLAATAEVALYEDFAHHPTAIRTTIAALRHKHPGSRIVAVVEPRSNTMRLGHHGRALVEALESADIPMAFCPRADDPVSRQVETERPDMLVRDAETVLSRLAGLTDRPTVMVLMSNGGFEDIPRRVAAQLGAGEAS